jgi:hypothetical protein
VADNYTLRVDAMTDEELRLEYEIAKAIIERSRQGETLNGFLIFGALFVVAGAVIAVLEGGLGWISLIILGVGGPFLWKSHKDSEECRKAEERRTAVWNKMEARGISLKEVDPSLSRYDPFK